MPTSAMLVPAGKVTVATCPGLSFGVSGFASAEFRRQTVDSVANEDGCVQLSVYSFAPGKLTVEGHTPCKVDPDCPEGEICDVLIETCITPP